jgi:hypothetical protein
MRALILAALLLAGCGTLRVTPKETSDLEIRALGPHLVRSTVDGEVRYEQTGPMALRLRAVEGTVLVADKDCVRGVCTLRDAREVVTP